MPCQHKPAGCQYSVKYQTDEKPQRPAPASRAKGEVEHVNPLTGKRTHQCSKYQDRLAVRFHSVAHACRHHYQEWRQSGAGSYEKQGSCCFQRWLLLPVHFLCVVLAVCRSGKKRLVFQGMEAKAFISATVQWPLCVSKKPPCLRLSRHSGYSASCR